MASETFAAMTAADVMTRNPRVCDAGSQVLDAVLIFREADCGAVPVIAGGKAVGVLTDRDVALALAEHGDALVGLPVAQVTTPGAVAVRPETPLNSVILRFGEKGVRRLLVTDEQDRLLGIIGWADIAPHVPDANIGRAVARVTAQAPNS